MKITILLSILLISINSTVSGVSEPTSTFLHCVDSEAFNRILHQMAEKYPDNSGNNGLQLAIINGEVNVANALINLLAEERFLELKPAEDSVNVDTITHFLHQRNNDDNTVLHLIAEHGSTELAHRICELQPQSYIYSQWNKVGECPLHIAVKNGDLDLVNLWMMDEINRSSHDSESCEQFRIFGYGHPLLRATGSGMTALDIAIDNGDAAMIDLVEMHARPITKLCNIPMKRFALYQNKLDHVVHQARAVIESNHLFMVQMSEAYLFEEFKGMTYLSPQELELYATRATNGKLLRRCRSDQPYHSDTPEFLYVLSKEGRLFIGSHDLGTFHHSSLLAGDDLLGAGHLTVKDGRIIELTSGSGHYTPKTIHLLQTAFILYDKGCLDEETQLQFMSLNINVRFGDILECLSAIGVKYSSECEWNPLEICELFDWETIQ